MNHTGFSVTSNRQTNRHNYEDRLNAEIEELTRQWKSKRILITDLESEHCGEFATVKGFAVANEKVAMIATGFTDTFYIFNQNGFRSLESAN